MFQVIGQVQPPPAIARFDPGVAGLSQFISALVWAAISIGGLYTFMNLILAGYQFLTSGADPKNVSNAWAKIYQSLIGLTILALSLLLAAVISLIIFKDPLFILSPKFYGPQ